jgi:PDZ domain-containing protein
VATRQTLERVPGGRAFAALSRRVRTLIVAGVLFLVLFVLALTMPVPYVILSPGPTYNTLGTDEDGNTIIVIHGKVPAKRAGNLNLTTVSVSGQSVSAFEAVAGWLSHDEVVVPSSSVYPPGQSEHETDVKNAADFVDSQDTAITAASCELGYPHRFGVVTVLGTGAAHDVLQPGDVLKSVNGQVVTNSDMLHKALAGKPPHAVVPIVVVRAGEQKAVSVKLGPALPGRTDGSLGITAGTVCATPFTVDLGLANEIGGPSAGLMFALGIMNKVGPVNLTKGRFIAGTGTIAADGKVGAIGGIALKMIAARDKGATVFLAPAANCDDVRGAVPDGLQVVKVSTLHQAAQDLVKIEKGQRVAGC